MIDIFSNKIKDLFKNSCISTENMPIIVHKVDAKLNEAEVLTDADIDKILKQNKIKVKLKTLTNFGIEYILAKPYPVISNILSNLKVDFENKDNKIIFVKLYV